MVADGSLDVRGHANGASMAIEKDEKCGHQPAWPVARCLRDRQLPTVAKYSLRCCSTVSHLTIAQ